MGNLILNIFHRNKQKHEWYGTEPTESAIEFAEIANISEGSKVLDLGCGYGRNSEYYGKLGADVDAINIDKKELEYAKSHTAGKVNYVYADASKLPFPDTYYDVVLDFGCSHQCDENTQIKIVQEVKRVLKPGGLLMYFGFSKNHPAYLNKKAKDPDYKNPQFRSEEDIRQQYENYFEIVKVTPHRWNIEKGYGYHEGLNIVMRKK